MREEARFWRMRFWWPREVSIVRGGLRERRVVVRRGMEDRKPRRIALERVEMAGEPKQRWW